MLYTRVSPIFVISKTYFPLRRPIPGNVTEPYPVPITDWLTPSLKDITISIKEEAETQKKIFENALCNKIGP